MVKQLLSIFAAAAVSFGAYADDPVLFKTYEAKWEYYSDDNEEGEVPDAFGTRTLDQYSNGTYKILNAFGSDAKKDVLTFVLTNDNITFQGLKNSGGVKYLYYNSPDYSYVYDTLYENGEYSSYSKEDGWDTVMFYIYGSAGNGYYYLYWQGEEIPDAYFENKASVDELTEAYAAGVKDLEETFPGYLVVKSEELAALKEQIDALAQKVNDALVEAGKTGEYDGPATSEINEVTASLIALLFSGPEETMMEINEAYENDKDKIDELKATVVELVKELEENYPEYYALRKSAIAALSAKIDELSQQIEEAYAAVAEVGEYDGPASGEINQITESIMSLWAGAEEFSYCATGHATVLESWEGYYSGDFAPAANVTVEVMKNNVIRLNAWAGVEGYDVIVAYDDEQNVTSLTPVWEGEVQEEVTEEYAYLNTGEEWVYAWVGQGYGYACSYDDESGYVLLVCAVNNDWRYYYIEWPLTANELTESIKEAYDTDLGTIDEWNAYIAELKATYPGYAATEAGSEAIAALAAEVDKYKEAVNAANEAAATNWGYITPLTGAIITEMNEKIISLVADIEETINVAYEADKAIIERLQAEYTECVKSVDSDFPGYLVLKKADLAALKSQIDGLAKKVEAAYEAALESGCYVGPTSEEMTAAEDSIQSLLVTGPDAQLDVIWDGVREDYSKIKTLRDDVEAYLANNPENELVAEILQQLDELQAQITEVAMKKAVEETGVYETPLNEEVMAELNAKIEDLKTSGIAAIEAAGAEARYFDINGREVNHPVSGKVYIKVENQKASKVMVK